MMNIDVSVNEIQNAKTYSISVSVLNTSA